MFAPVEEKAHQSSSKVDEKRKPKDKYKPKKQQSKESRDAADKEGLSPARRLKVDDLDWPEDLDKQKAGQGVQGVEAAVRAGAHLPNVRVRLGKGGQD